MSELPELKSCPFCGGEASVGTVKYSPCDITKLNNREKGYFVNCQMCSARNELGISYATEAEAVKHWNTRYCHDDLVAIKKTIQDKSDKLDARIADGKHDDAWPNPDYIKDTDWAGMIGERLVYHYVLRLFEAALAKAK